MLWYVRDIVRKATVPFVTDAHGLTLYECWRKSHCISVYISVVVRSNVSSSSFIVPTIKVCFLFLRSRLWRLRAAQV